MKVLLVTPNFHQPRGNTVTVQRIADGLGNLGIQTEIISITEESAVTTLPVADITHGFNAFHFYKFMQKLDRKLDSYMVTMTGTDLNHDLFNPNNREDVIRSLTGAAIIHVFDEKAKQILISEVPIIKKKIRIIPQGTTHFKETKLPFNKEEGTFLFLLPAGIRRVKNIPFAIESLKTLHEDYPGIRLWIVGPIIEEGEASLVSDLVNNNKDWVNYLGQVEHFNMGSVYKEAAVVLNTSHSEGQPAAILEAMGHGIAVLVANNQGNLSIVSNGETGFVYRNQCEFLDYAADLVNNKSLRENLGQNAQRYVDSHHSSEFEAETFRKIYQQILDEAYKIPIPLKE